MNNVRDETFLNNLQAEFSTSAQQWTHNRVREGQVLNNIRGETFLNNLPTEFSTSAQQ